MPIKMNKVSLLAALLMGAAAASFSTNAMAVSCSGADAGSATVAAFKNDPSSVLSSADLASAIQLIAVTDSDLLSDIIAMARTASADQQSAIGEGLGQAASACVADQAAYAAEIQTEVEGVGGPLKTAFAASTNEVETAAVGTPGNQTITPTGDTGTGTAVVGGTDSTTSGSNSETTTGSSTASSSSPGSTTPSFSSTGAASSNARNVSPST